MEINKDAEVKFTRDWWKRVANDEPRLIAWLQKLHGTEVGGYNDYKEFIRKYLWAGQPSIRDNRKISILNNIADDELKHGGLIEKVLDARGYKLDPASPASLYWKEMDSHIKSITSACAVNYYGEALAAFRFEVLIDDPNTPSDIKEMLGIILPDEQFHRTTLRRLAGDEALAKFKEIHENAVKALKKT